MGAYGTARANDANVVYPLAQSLPAARAVNNLALEVEATKAAVGAAVDAVMRNWQGPHRDTVNTNATTFSTSCDSAAGALSHLASGIAAGWAGARGQQDRINFARYVQWDISQDSWLENGVEFFKGETDYGPQPDNPPTPAAVWFLETRDPIKPGFQ